MKSIIYATKSLFYFKIAGRFMVAQPSLIASCFLFIPLQMIASTVYEDFVMTPIKCPPPKIVAVKRSLKRPTKKNIMDDDDDEMLSVNDNDSLSSFDTKDLIEFEKDEPLIDLSDSEPPDVHISQDTMLDKNSTTLLSLLDLLEIGSRKETEDTTSCAEGALPFVPLTSSSSSLQNIPVECPGACATPSGKTDKLSTVFPPLSIEPENLSLVKNHCHDTEASKSGESEGLKSPASDNRTVDEREREGIDENFIDSTTLRISQSENFTSTSISFSSQPGSDCSIKARDSSESHRNESENYQKNPGASEKSTNELSDTNNNHESVCNQNSVEKSLASSFELAAVVTHDTSAKQQKHQNQQRDDSEYDENLKFLSPHTSQRKLPPKFYSSTSSLNQDCFEASSRLKRLEERFRGFSYTKKLLRSSKVFSKSEEILSSYGRVKEFDSLNSPSSQHQFPLSSTTLSENCLRQLTENEKSEEQKDPRKDGEFLIEQQGLMP